MLYTLNLAIKAKDGSIVKPAFIATNADLILNTFSEKQRKGLESHLVCSSQAVINWGQGASLSRGEIQLNYSPDLELYVHDHLSRPFEEWSSFGELVYLGGKQLRLPTYVDKTLQSMLALPPQEQGKALPESEILKELEPGEPEED